MNKWLRVGGIFGGALCGFCILAVVGVVLLMPDDTTPTPPQPSPDSGREQVAVATSVPLPLTPSPQAARGDTIVPTVEPTEIDMLTKVQSAMDGIPLLDVLDVVVNDDTRIFVGDLKGIVQVTYRTPSNNRLEVMKVHMQDIVCAYLGTGYNGFRLRIAGKNAADITLITAAIEPDILAQIDCSKGSIHWENATSEWVVASGVQ